MAVAAKRAALTLLIAFCCHLPTIGETSAVKLYPTGSDKLVSIWPVDWKYPRSVQPEDEGRSTVVIKRYPVAPHLHQRAADKDLVSLRSSSSVWLTNSPDTRCTSSSPWSSTCWVVRQVGSSLTLEVDVLDASPSPFLRYLVHWFQRFKLYGEANVLSTEITEDGLPANMALGNGGQELRLRPLHCYDMDENSFRSVVSRTLYPGSQAEFVGNITFRILQIPIDMGEKNPGEELRISIQDHMTLPADQESGIKIRWRAEEAPGRYSALASNMITSSSGRTLSVLGLRDDQSGIIACSVYDAAGVFFGKKRFLIMVVTESADRTTHLESFHKNVTDSTSSPFWIS